MITAIIALVGGALLAIIGLAFVVWGIRRRDESMVVLAILVFGATALMAFVHGFETLEKWEARQPGGVQSAK